MKVQGQPAPLIWSRPVSTPPDAGAAGGPGRALDNLVQLSPAASFVDATRRLAGSVPTIREDVVAAMKAELAAGTFGGPADVSAAIDAILAEAS